MSEPFLSEIKIVSFNSAPRGWAFCNRPLAYAPCSERQGCDRATPRLRGHRHPAQNEAFVARSGGGVQG